jgi:hypothetical protein
MVSYLLWMIIGLHSVAQAAQLVSIKSDPLYQALPFCARDCVWNDYNNGDIASGISLSFPCYNSCYCNPDTIDDALSALSQCITSSPCCDMTDYSNAVFLYYEYCSAHETWPVLPPEVGPAPPSPTFRTTLQSTASWCSTARFSPTPTSTTGNKVPTAAATNTAASNSSGISPKDFSDGIVLPSVVVGLGTALLLFVWVALLYRKKMRSKEAILPRRQPNSTPQITISHELSLRPSSARPLTDHIGAADGTGAENDSGAKGGKGAVDPPPYSP